MRHPWSIYERGQCVGVGTIEAPTADDAIRAVLGGGHPGFTPRPDRWYSVRCAGRTASAQGAEFEGVAAAHGGVDTPVHGVHADRAVEEAKRATREVMIEALGGRAAVAGKALAEMDPLDAIIDGAREPLHPKYGPHTTWIDKAGNEYILNPDPSIRPITCQGDRHVGVERWVRDNANGTIEWLDVCRSCGSGMGGPGGEKVLRDSGYHPAVDDWRAKRCKMGIHDRVTLDPGTDRQYCRDCGWKSAHVVRPAHPDANMRMLADRNYENFRRLPRGSAPAPFGIRRAYSGAGWEFTYREADGSETVIYITDEGAP